MSYLMIAGVITQRKIINRIMEENKNWSSIIIKQLIFCTSYKEALKVSKAFERLSIRVFFLGNRCTIHPKRFIRKFEGSTYYSHKVLVQYVIKYSGVFDSYGFVDNRTVNRVPQIINELKETPESKRWEVAFKYEHSDDDMEMYDVYYYESFDALYKRRLKSLLDRINLACQISFSRRLNTEFFEIIYEEKGQYYSMFHYSEKGLESISLVDNDDILVDDEFIALNSVWQWAQEHYYNKKERWASEARAWVSLSNALNHAGYESLLYSIIGLEYIYTKEKRFIKRQLMESIPKVFNNVTSEEIDNLYKIRSEFAHGSLAFPLYGEKEFITEYVNVNKAAAILLETVRLLIKNDATRINVEGGEIKYIKDDTIRSRLLSEK